MEHKRNADDRHALVRVALAAVRAAPDVRAEQVSQETLGAVLEVLERTEGWARVRGEDGYEGWMSVGGLAPCDAAAARAWREGSGGRPAVVLDATVVDDEGRVVVRLPWGARVAIDGPTARLPGGRTGRLADGEWVLEEELAVRFPPSGTAVLATARAWMGVPYLWGGRTRWGADCSGFAAAVYRLHGVRLPRDSHQQAKSGEPVSAGAGFAEVRAGDLLFFRAERSERIVHAAFSMGGPAILHAAQRNGCVAEDSLAGESELERSLAARLVAVRRMLD